MQTFKTQFKNYWDDTLEIGDQNIEIVDSFRYLGDEFTSGGDYLKLCKERAQKSFETITELISICKEVNLGKNQISNMILSYHSVWCLD